MITILNIKQEWTILGETLNPLTSQKIEKLGLRLETIDFLKNCGLPNHSAPMLSFVKNSENESDSINKLSDLFELSIEFDKYITIGFDGSGNPIVINTANNDQIELLDHEENFESLAIVNFNIYSFSASLISYNLFIKTIIEENGDDAFLEANFSDKQFDVLRNKLFEIESHSAKFGFWKTELDFLISDRDYNRKNIT